MAREIKFASPANGATSGTGLNTAATLTFTPANASTRYFYIGSGTQRTGSTAVWRSVFQDQSGPTIHCDYTHVNRDTTDVVPFWHFHSAVSPASPVSQTHTIQFSTSTGTLNWEGAQILAFSAENLGASDGDAYSESLVETQNGTTTTAAPYLTKVSLSLNVGTAGDYLFIAYGDGRVSQNSRTIDLRLTDDGTTFYNPRVWFPFVSGSTRSLPIGGLTIRSMTAGTHTINMDFTHGGTPDAVFLKNARLAAIRLTGRFDNAATGWTVASPLTAQTFTNTTYGTASVDETLSDTGPADYLVFGNSNFYIVNSTSASTAARFSENGTQKLGGTTEIIVEGTFASTANTLCHQSAVYAAKVSYPSGAITSAWAWHHRTESGTSYRYNTMVAALKVPSTGQNETGDATAISRTTGTTAQGAKTNVNGASAAISRTLGFANITGTKTNVAGPATAIGRATGTTAQGYAARQNVATAISRATSTAATGTKTNVTGSTSALGLTTATAATGLATRSQTAAAISRATGTTAQGYATRSQVAEAVSHIAGTAAQGGKAAAQTALPVGGSTAISVFGGKDALQATLVVALSIATVGSGRRTLEPPALVGPTRLYLPYTGSSDAPVSPAFDAGWDDTASAVRTLMRTTKSGTPLTNVTTTEATTAANWDMLHRQFISEPFAWQVTVSGTWIGAVRGQESSEGGNMVLQSRLCLVDSTGGNVRILAALGTPTGTSNEFPDPTDTPNFASRRIPYNTTTANNGFGVVANLTSQTANPGDRLVLEIGARANNTQATSFSYTLQFGDAAGTDLSDTASDSSAANPWIQFSAGLPLGEWKYSDAGTGLTVTTAAIGQSSASDDLSAAASVLVLTVTVGAVGSKTTSLAAQALGRSTATTAQGSKTAVSGGGTALVLVSATVSVGFAVRAQPVQSIGHTTATTATGAKASALGPADAVQRAVTTAAQGFAVRLQTAPALSLGVAVANVTGTRNEQQSSSKATVPLAYGTSAAATGSKTSVSGSATAVGRVAATTAQGGKAATLPTVALPYGAATAAQGAKTVSGNAAVLTQATGTTAQGGKTASRPAAALSYTLGFANITYGKAENTAASRPTIPVALTTGATAFGGKEARGPTTLVAYDLRFFAYGRKQLEPPVLTGPTRFYLPYETSAGAPISPAYTTGWDLTTGAVRSAMKTARGTTAVTNVTLTKSSASNNYDMLFRQYVSEPFAWPVSLSGTVKGAIRGLVSANANNGFIQQVVKLVDSTGGNERILYALGTSTATNNAHEFTTAAGVRSIPAGNFGATFNLTAQTANTGDRLVFEIGQRLNTTSTAVTATLAFGDNQATDIPETTTTSTLNPWLELSMGLPVGEWRYSEPDPLFLDDATTATGFKTEDQVESGPTAPLVHATGTTASGHAIRIQAATAVACTTATTATGFAIRHQTAQPVGRTVATGSVTATVAKSGAAAAISRTIGTSPATGTRTEHQAGSKDTLPVGYGTGTGAQGAKVVNLTAVALARTTATAATGVKTGVAGTTAPLPAATSVSATAGPKEVHGGAVASLALGHTANGTKAVEGAAETTLTPAVVLTAEAHRFGSVTVLAGTLTVSTEHVQLKTGPGSGVVRRRGSVVLTVRLTGVKVDEKPFAARVGRPR